VTGTHTSATTSKSGSVATGSRRSQIYQWMTGSLPTTPSSRSSLIGRCREVCGVNLFGVFSLCEQHTATNLQKCCVFFCFSSTKAFPTGFAFFLCEQHTAKTRISIRHPLLHVHNFRAKERVGVHCVLARVDARVTSPARDG
jgi:hypothetical protein